ncbi:MAG: class I SAM-dependent methyltransferase [Polyangiaceae bacterium]
MSFFMAALYDGVMRPMEDACGHAWRGELLSDLRGAVLEVGAGTGRNLDHYPRELDRLVLLEPDPHMARRLRKRLGQSPFAGRAEVLEADLDHAALAPASFDVVVATLVLCSVPDVPAALASMRRLLKPGGELRFLEHVASDDPSRLAWQRRLEPLWKRVAGGCHLCRHTEASIEAGGFRLERVERASARRALPIVRATVRGVARRVD